MLEEIVVVAGCCEECGQHPDRISTRRAFSVFFEAMGWNGQLSKIEETIWAEIWNLYVKIQQRFTPSPISWIATILPTIDPLTRIYKTHRTIRSVRFWGMPKVVDQLSSRLYRRTLHACTAAKCLLIESRQRKCVCAMTAVSVRIAAQYARQLSESSYDDFNRCVAQVVT